MTDIVIAQTTIDDEERAEALARGAVEGGLAACAHVDAPFTAVYRWENRIATAREWRVSYKTTTDRLAELEAWVAGRHSYDVPEWITLPVTGGSEAYLSWVAEETGERHEGPDTGAGGGVPSHEDREVTAVSSNGEHSCAEPDRDSTALLAGPGAEGARTRVGSTVRR